MKNKIWRAVGVLLLVVFATTGCIFNWGDSGWQEIPSDDGWQEITTYRT